jgi:hypothetical protein
MNAAEIHKKLAQQGIRLFALSLGSDKMFFAHGEKTVNDWRTDVRKFIAEIGQLVDTNGDAESKVINQLLVKLCAAGYVEVNDIVADVFEGRIAVYSAGIVDDPAHEEQADGFGHYGWESKTEQ